MRRSLLAVFLFVVLAARVLAAGEPSYDGLTAEPPPRATAFRPVSAGVKQAAATGTIGLSAYVALRAATAVAKSAGSKLLTKGLTGLALGAAIQWYLNGKLDVGPMLAAAAGAILLPMVAPAAISTVAAIAGALAAEAAYRWVRSKWREPRTAPDPQAPATSGARPGEPGFAAERASELAADLTAHGAPPSAWEDPGRRRTLLNVRAKLAKLGVWEHVEEITFARYETRARSRRVIGGKSRLFGELVSYTIDAENGWEVAFRMKPGVDLKQKLRDSGAEFLKQHANHFEGAWQLKELGTGNVIHFIGVKPPNGQWTDVHFDAGGGLPTPSHLKDVKNGTGVTQESVTEALVAEGGMDRELYGITPGLDERLRERVTSGRTAPSR